MKGCAGFNRNTRIYRDGARHEVVSIIYILPGSWFFACDRSPGFYFKDARIYRQVVHLYFMQLVLKTINQVNENVATINTFTDLQKGVMFPETVEFPELPPLTGVWFDQWSFQQNFSDIQNNYYNDVTHVWFGGAASPWSTETAKGMGIRFSEDMTFTWLIAEHSPVTGCESYSAEYITGTAALSGDQITFNQDYWRSKFINSCDPTQNVDMDVTPSPIVLRYEIAQKSNLWTGELFWELKFSNPDGSNFSYYRR